MLEYLERFDHDPNSVGDPVEQKYRPGRVCIVLIPGLALIVSVRSVCGSGDYECRGVCTASSGPDLRLRARSGDANPQASDGFEIY